MQIGGDLLLKFGFFFFFILCAGLLSLVRGFWLYLYISIFGCVCLLAFSSLLWFIASLVFLQPLVFLLLEKFDESITVYALACSIWLLGWITLSLVVDDKFARPGNDILLKITRIVLVSEFALLYFFNYNSSLGIETLNKVKFDKVAAFSAKLLYAAIACDATYI